MRGDIWGLRRPQGLRESTLRLFVHWMTGPIFHVHIIYPVSTQHHDDRDPTQPGTSSPCRRERPRDAGQASHALTKTSFNERTRE